MYGESCKELIERESMKIEEIEESNLMGFYQKGGISVFLVRTP